MRHRRFNRLGAKRKVAGDLIPHEQRNLAKQGAEAEHLATGLPHLGQLVLHQRMIDQMKIGKLAEGFHAGTFKPS